MVHARDTGGQSWNLHPLPKKLWKQLGKFAVLFAVLFTIIAAAEYLFVRHQRDEAIASGLEQTIADVSDALNLAKSGSTTAYRQADIQASSYFVIGPDGLLVDVDNFQPGFLVNAIPPQQIAFNRPEFITTSIGEVWLIEARKVAGGLVIGGILSTNAKSLKNPQNLLATELAKFGTTFKEAAKVKPSDISNYIDGYAIMDDFGEVKNVIGGVPIRVRLNQSPDMCNEQVFSAHFGGQEYAGLIHSMSAPSGMTILAFDDTTDEAAVLDLYRRFSAITVIVVWVVALAVVGIVLVKSEMTRRRQEISLEDALTTGEGPNIEFKAGVVDRTITQTMSAFGNTDSGNLFLGVNDNAEVVGLDDAQTPKERDVWQQKISSWAREVIQPPLLVYPRFFVYQGKVVLRLFIPRGSAVAYMVQREAFIRHLASVRKATGPEDFKTILASHERYWG